MAETNNSVTVKPYKDRWGVYSTFNDRLLSVQKTYNKTLMVAKTYVTEQDVEDVIIEVPGHQIDEAMA